MDTRAKVREAMARVDGVKVAKAPPPFPPKQGQDEGGGGGGFPPSQHGFTPANRQIPKNHKFDPGALKPLAKMLWAMSVSMGHALQAYRTFNRVKSSTVSPDGMLGGRGYVMKVTELRQKLYDAVEALSAISDTIHDEINAPHWKPKLAELEKEDFEAIGRLIGESEEMLDDPEGEVEEEEEEVEKKGKPSKSWAKKPSKSEKNGPSSEMPDGGDQETVPAPQQPFKTKEASAYDHRTFVEKVASNALDILANSSIPTQTLPGPRVQHLDRGDSDQTGPFGSVNQDEPFNPADQWSKDEGVGGEYNYPSEWENDTSKQGESALPADGTATEGYDFGIGRGNGNDAHGQGAGGYGEASPSMGDRGVYSPAAELPSDPAGKTKDNEESDSNPSIDMHLNDRIKQARAMLTFFGVRRAQSEYPHDDGDDVARADYFTGPKPDNDSDTVRSNTELPGDESAANDEFDKDLMDTGYRYERQDQPYTKWDDSTHNQRPDWINMRTDQGPYVKQ